MVQMYTCSIVLVKKHDNSLSVIVIVCLQLHCSSCCDIQFYADICLVGTNGIFIQFTN